MSMGYNPKGGAKALHQPSVHGPGSAPVKPADSAHGPAGMSHSSSGATSHLKGQDRREPCKDGPTKSY